MNRNLDLPQVRAARVAGLGYLAIIVCGIFAELIIRSTLIESGNPAATAANIAESESLFRVSIASDLVMLIFDVVVGVALYRIFVPVHRQVALLATLFRLVHTAVYGAALLFLFFVVQLAAAPGSLTGVAAEQRAAFALLFAEAHSFGYALALLFFTVHVLLLGYLCYESGFVPRPIAALVVFAGAGYLVDTFANVLLTSYADYETAFAVVVFVPAFAGELALAGWLVMKGFLGRGRESRTLSAAQ